MTAVWCRIERDVVAARGADAESFLQGQCSQDVARIDAGSSAWSFVLQPTGKVDVLCRIHRVNDQTFLLDTEAGYGPALLARLQRFKLRVAVELDTVDWEAMAVRGLVVPTGPGALAAWWGQADAVDLLGPGVEPPPGATEIGPGELERLRVEAGWPAMGHELTADTIPAESGVVGLAASFTKGCYTGQELVARIDSRGGNVARRLRRLRFDPSARVAPGARLVVDGHEAGWVTTVAPGVALAYASRAVVPPATGTVDGTAVTVEAIVAASPPG